MWRCWPASPRSPASRTRRMNIHAGNFERMWSLHYGYDLSTHYSSTMIATKASAMMPFEKVSERWKKVWASMTLEERSEVARKREAAKTFEQKSENGRK